MRGALSSILAAALLVSPSAASAESETFAPLGALVVVLLLEEVVVGGMGVASAGINTGIILGGEPTESAWPGVGILFGALNVISGAVWLLAGDGSAGMIGIGIAHLGLGTADVALGIGTSRLRLPTQVPSEEEEDLDLRPSLEGTSSAPRVVSVSFRF